MTDALNDLLAVEATDDQINGIARQYNGDNRQVEPFFRNPQSGRRAQQAITYQQYANAQTI